MLPFPFPSSFLLLLLLLGVVRYAGSVTSSRLAVSTRKGCERDLIAFFGNDCSFLCSRQCIEIIFASLIVPYSFKIPEYNFK